MFFMIFKYIKKKLPYKFKKNVKNELEKFFRNLQQISSKKIVKSKYGILLRNNFTDQTFRFYINASYGYFFWDFLSNISTNFIFIDIGSNQGLYTICAAKNKFCSKVYSFEPVNSTFKLLTENVSINNLSDKCNLINKAISDKNGKLNISLNTNHTGTATFRKKNWFEEFDKKEKIEVIDQEQLNILIKDNKNSQFIIKVDVEGYEEIVFQTLIKSNFFKKTKVVFYEVDEKWINPEKLKKLLTKEGFTKFTKIGNGSHYDVLGKR